MEKVKKKRARRHVLRNLPLRWSFMLYVLACVVVAVVLSVVAAATLASMQSDIYDRYMVQRDQALGLSEGGIGEEDDDAHVLEIVYNVRMTPEDSRLYNLYSALSILSVPLVSLLCIVATGMAFYSRKLKQPLQLIDASSARIAAGDLDFSVHYENRNEMGRLVASFETMRAALEANHRELWHMMAQREQLNAAFAHDLRTPLTVLKGYVEYLRTYVPQGRIPEDKMMATLELMHGYVSRLEGYTASMGAMRKLEEVRPVPRALSFADLCEHLQGAAGMLRGTARLHFACEGGGVMAVDPDIVTQVLENMVANAARFAATEIKVALSRTEDMLCIAVSDDGPGFSGAVLAKGAAPYNRPKEDASGEHFGLGLYICTVLCRRHGGALRLPDAEGSAEVTATFAIGEESAGDARAIPHDATDRGRRAENGKAGRNIAIPGAKKGEATH